MDPGKRKTLLDWVNSFFDSSIKNFMELSDGSHIVEIIKYMQLKPDGSSKLNLHAENRPWVIVKDFLSGTDLSNAVSHIIWHTLEDGNELELSKVVILLLSLTITCPNKEKLITEMNNFEYSSQVHLRHILSAALSENDSSESGYHLFDLATQKAPTCDQPDIDAVESPAKGSTSMHMPPLDSPAFTTTPVHSRTGIFQTPVKQIFKSMEEEEVFSSVPATCPPLRRGCNLRYGIQDLPSFNMSAECSPMQEFFSSPVVNYRIKIRDLDQKITILEKNLQAERISKEECEKALTEKETALENLERTVRNMSRCSVEKQQLFDEIDELHTIRMDRDNLQKENSKLKHRLEKFDTYSTESKDLKRDLDEQIRLNSELSKQVTSLRSSLDKVSNDKQKVSDLEESLKSIQERNSSQEQEISHLLTQLHKLKSQNVEQKEHYESRISDYKSIIEDKESSGIEHEGESMGIFLEHRVLELQETLKEMEENWIKPDTAAKLRTDLDAAKIAVDQYQIKVQTLTSEKVSLEEDVCRLQQEVTAKTGEVMDSMKRLASTTQKLKQSETASETLRSQVDILTGDKELLKGRVKSLESDVVESNAKLSKMQMELDMSKNENENNTMALQRHVRRLSDSNHKIADYEHKCRSLDAEVLEKNAEIEEIKKTHKLQLESLEKNIVTEKKLFAEQEERVKSLEQDKESSTNKIQELSKILIEKKQSILDAGEEIESLKLEVKKYHLACSELEKSLSDSKLKFQDSETASSKKLQSKDAEIGKLQEEDCANKKRIASFTEEAEKMKNEHNLMNQTLEESKEKLKNAKDAYRNLENENAKLQSDVQSGVERCTNMGENLRIALASCKKLEDDVSATKVYLEENEKEKESLVLTSEKLKEDNSNLYAQLSEVSESLRLSKKEYDDSQEILLDLKRKLEVMEAELEESRISEGKYDEEVVKLEEKLENESERASILEIKLKEVEDAGNLHKDEVEELKKESQINSGERKKLEEKIKLLEMQMEVDAIARDETVQDLISVKSEVEASEKNHKDDVIRLNSIIDSLQMNISTTEEKLKDAEEEAVGLRSRNNVIENQLQSSSSDLEMLRNQYETPIKNQEEAEQQINELKMMLESSGRDSQDRCNALKQEKENMIEFLREEIRIKDSTLEEMENAKTSLRNDLESLKLSSIEDSELNTKMIESLQGEIQKKDSIVQNLVESKDSLEKEIESLRAAHEEANQENIRSKESLEEVLSEKDVQIAGLEENKSSLFEEVESLKLMLEKSTKEKESFFHMEETLASMRQERDSACQKIQEMTENHTSMIKNLQNVLAAKDSVINEGSMKLESVVEMMNSEKEQYQQKLKSLESQLESKNQAEEYLKVENEVLQKRLDEITNDYHGKVSDMQSNNDKTKEMLENERIRYATLEARLKKEVLGAENELSEAKNMVRVISDEKQFYEDKCVELENTQKMLQENISCLQSDVKRAENDKSQLLTEVESLKNGAKNSDEKLKAIRAQFAEKYREKQERMLKLEQDLKDWQARADDQTNKYDNMAAMYNEKRSQLNETTTDLDQIRGENLDLQETVRSMKLKIDSLTSNNSQLKKIEEEKKNKSLSAEILRLNTQLQHADRVIRELRMGSSYSHRHSSYSTQTLMTVEEAITPRRRSLDISSDDVLSNDNLFRCHSDSFLDSPTTANKKIKKEQQVEVLDDSLEDVLRTPVNLQSRGNLKSDPTSSSDIQNLKSATYGVNRSHISIESSFLAESPSHIRPRLSHNMSRSSQDSTDINMNSSNLAEASFSVNGTHNNTRRRIPSALAFQTEEEPEDYEWGSLSRLAELQRRNAVTLPHLKSSYPIETQGKTPSKCDETVRIGDADGTLRRMTQLPENIQKSLTSSMNEIATTSRRMTMDPSVSRSGQGEMRASIGDNQWAKRKNSSRDDSQDNLPHKNRREGSTGSGGSATGSQWRNDIPWQEDKEQIDPIQPDRRMSMMFEIPNSPKKPILRSRTARKNVTVDKLKENGASNTSKRLSSITKTPDKSKTLKKNLEEKRRTPSLMDRVKKPLGRFNRK